MDSGAIYGLVAATLRGERQRDALRARAFAAPIERWERVLGFDGCALHFARALQGAGLAEEVPSTLRTLLREATITAIERAVMVHRQVAEVASLAQRSGIRVMALKGAARLLGGEMPGTRSIADIDLLVRPDDAARLHALLQADLAYVEDAQPYAHHLAGLTRGGSLGVEVHVRLTPTPLALDDEMWRDSWTVVLRGASVELPSRTSLFLHTLEHAVRVNWTGRYRLRDVADLAALYTPEVDDARIRRYVEASDCRGPMLTVLGAARRIEPRIPLGSPRGWRTVNRVGRFRIALATLPRTPRVAERLFRYAGVIAEGRPGTLGRAGLDAARRLVGARAALGLAIAALAVSGGCHDAAAPRPLVVKPFVFAANSGGVWSLYRFRAGTVTRLSSPGNNDREPHGAKGRIVFTSLRDGNAEIYSAAVGPDLTLGAETRLTNEGSTDAEPALAPSGATIAFVSGRDGAPRVWLMDVTGENPRALETGSPTFIPEGAPSWSPTGDRIAFTSSRSGTSQVYVVSAAGGVPVQVSHETRGAYNPAWRPDGAAVLFMALSGEARVMSAPAVGGDAVVVASDTAGIGEPDCTPSACLAVLAPLGGAARVIALDPQGRRATVVLPQVADDHHPAFLVP